MSEFKVGCSPITSVIYAGTVLKGGIWAKNRVDVTDTAVPAVAQYLLQKDESMEFEYEGERYRLQVVKVPKK